MLFHPPPAVLAEYRPPTSLEDFITQPLSQKRGKKEQIKYIITINTTILLLTGRWSFTSWQHVGSYQVTTCVSAHLRQLYNACPLGNEATNTMT